MKLLKLILAALWKDQDELDQLIKEYLKEQT